MKPGPQVQITLLTLSVNDELDKRVGNCQLLIEFPGPLPQAPYAGTVRVGGRESTATGFHMCRLLKHFTVEYLEDTPSGVLYKITIDLTDDHSYYSPGYANSNWPGRELTESIEVIFKRIAGLFGRHCEQYRPSSVIFKTSNKKSSDDLA